jgi:hypothetical protein
MIEPAGLKPVALPATAQRAPLDRRVRASARLTREIGERKVRVIELSRQLMSTVGPVWASPAGSDTARSGCTGQGMGARSQAWGASMLSAEWRRTVLCQRM